MDKEYYKRPRLYVEPSLTAKAPIQLDRDKSHYLTHVMRLKQGDTARLFNGRDGEWLCELEQLGKKDWALTPVSQLRAQTHPAKETYLFFAPLKKARMDFLIEKAVELGVSHLYPVLTQNCEVRALKTERVSSQIIESTEQCERLSLPKLHDLIRLEKAIDAWDGADPIAAAIERVDAPHVSDIKASALLIGPEGGWTHDEKDMLERHKHIQAVSLGDTILRAETASLVALTFIMR